MLLSVRNLISFFSIMAAWAIAGAVSEIIAIILVLLTLILFFQKERYYEALLGFLVLLVFSDSYESMFHFAVTVKPFYLIVLAYLTYRIPTLHNKNYDFLVRFGPFLLIALLCVLFSPIPLISIQKIVSYSLLLFAIPNLFLFEYRRHGYELLVSVVAVSLVLYAISILIAIFLPEIGTSHGGRWRGIFGNPNGLGLFLTVSYLLFRVVFKRVPHLLTKLGYFIYYSIFIILVWKSGSRNALLSVLIFEIVVFGFKYSKPLTILVLITIISFIDYISDFTLSVLINLGLESELRLDDIDEGSGRLIAWNFAYEEIKKGMIILGNGLGYDEYFMKKNFKLLSYMGHEGGVHNTYLILWLNTGLLGLIAFFAAFFSFYSTAFKKNSYAFGAMLAILSSVTYEPWLSASLNPYTSISILLIVIFIYVKDEDEDEDEENKQ
ncbi:MAG: O-antigen ligase family protein [Crocinitomicaceae bacterium]